MMVRSRAIGLAVLLPATVAGVAIWPVLLVCSVLPILGLFTLPILFSVSCFLLYGVTWSLHAYLASSESPLPFSPIRCGKISLHALRIAKDFVAANGLNLVIDAQVRKLLLLGSSESKAAKIIHENIPYGNQGQKLDVYSPAPSQSGRNVGPRPTIVVVGGGNWSFWRKRMGSLIALRMRRLGYAVVVPQLRSFPKAKATDMVSDMRHALEWTANSVDKYGGDSSSIYLLSYGSGAHIATLTLVQDAVVRSRDEYLVKSSPSGKGGADVSSGIRRCTISGAEAQLPTLKGVICVSGTYDIIKQLRFEAKLGIGELSALKRACGPSTSTALLNCPSHLLYGASHILDPSRLPPQFLIIAGGKDRDVPYSQAVLLKTLLAGIGIRDVRLRLYRDETHFGSLASLMRTTRYSPFFLNEIEALIRGGGR